MTDTGRTKDKAQYRAANESALILHEAATKALKAVQAEGGKLPNPAGLQKSMRGCKLKRKHYRPNMAS